MCTEPKGRVSRCQPAKVARAQPATESQKTFVESRWKKASKSAQGEMTQDVVHNWLNGNEARTVPMMISNPSAQRSNSTGAFVRSASGPALAARLHQGSVSGFFPCPPRRVSAMAAIEVPTKEMAGIALPWSNMATKTMGLAKAALYSANVSRPVNWPDGTVY